MDFLGYPEVLRISWDFLGFPWTSCTAGNGKETKQTKNTLAYTWRIPRSDILGFSLDFFGVLWGLLGFPGIYLEFLGFSWILLDFLGYPEVLGISKDFLGIPWISLDFVGFPWIS